jgi:phosphatidylethanolamine/phosphatidyl-N-methylethanolamine N-methyltransferase
VGGGNGAEAPLSVTGVENDLVSRVYRRLAAVYDLVFGPALHDGRIKALERMELRGGEHILEVGIGTGLSATRYPPGCRVTGIDYSASMLAKAHRRFRRREAADLDLVRMDAARMSFPDNTFDVVYAAYVISVVPDPVQVAREMRRVCRPGGRILILNHFRSDHPLLARAERLISPWTVHVGFRSDVHLEGFLTQAEMTPVSVEKVNIPRLWSLVTCMKEGADVEPRMSRFSASAAP